MRAAIDSRDLTALGEPLVCLLLVELGEARCEGFGSG